MKNTVKFLLISLILISGISMKAQSFTPSVNTYGYIPYLEAKPLDVAQLYNPRMAVTLSFIANDLDTLAARASRGTSYGLTSGYIPVAGASAIANSSLYQKGGYVRDTAAFSVHGVSTLIGAATVSGLATFNKPVTTNILAPVPFDSTGTIGAATLARGWVTSTSGSAETLTLPTATLMATQLAGGQGVEWEFVIDNTGGSNTVTVAAGSGMTVAAIITGGNTLTVGSGHLGVFRLYFYSTTAAYLGRIL